MTTISTGWPGTTRAASMRRNPAAAWRHIDFVLLGSMTLISIIGSVMVFSTTSGTDPAVRDTTLLERHLVFLAAGVSAMLLVAIVDYRRFRDLALLGYITACALLLLVVSPFGSEIRSTERWLDIGPVQFQPSEVAKVAVILMLASVCANFAGDIDIRRLGLLLAVAGTPFLLILFQPDLGTGLVLVAITMAILLVAGVRAKHIAALTLVGLFGVVGILNSGVLEDYQTERLSVFLNPSTGLQAEAYNLNQSKIAVGSGGIAGKGVFKGTQTQLDIVPEQETDFIFTAVGEELGFVGSATLLLLFGVVCWRIWRIAQISRDLLGQLICVGMLALIAFQVFQNTGMTMGIMPITGLPLPLVSYGGTAMVATFAGLGLVQSVHMRRFA